MIKVLSFVKFIFSFLSVVSFGMFFPAIVAFFLGENGMILPFVIPAVSVLAIAITINIIFKNVKIKLSARGGFFYVASCWIFASLFGSLPMYLSGFFPTFADALFEAASGFTTTGATILGDVEVLPRCINLWRCEMIWFGGMGIVALTVAFMPILGVGGFQLIKAETTGPEKGKITPKIADMSKILWLIYSCFTAIQTVLLMICGMDFIDAISYSFSTLGAGGFTPHNAGVGTFNSPAMDWICTIFMFMAGINFSLYFSLIRRRFSDITENSELKAYCGIVVVASILVSVAIYPDHSGLFDTIEKSTFQVVSILTTTGFVMEDYDLWPPMAKIVLFLLYFVGGCSGSAGGGIKVVRHVVLFKQLRNEINRMLHPRGIYNIVINKRAGRKDIVFSVTSFIFAYMCIVVLTAIVAAVDGADMFSSITAGLALVGNVGPGFGAVGAIQNYGFFSSAAKLWFSIAMIAGRLEIFTIIIFFFPAYWRK